MVLHLIVVFVFVFVLVFVVVVVVLLVLVLEGWNSSLGICENVKRNVSIGIDSLVDVFGQVSLGVK